MRERLLWFITRPERDPATHLEALLALRDATDNFKVKWSGNREAHLNYEQSLIKYGVKRENISRDGSGGRTWAAMLKTFAYCYTNTEGFLVPTRVGQSLLSKHKVAENIKKQILTLQIPNAYFLESGFKPKFAEGFQIRPARFLMKLTNQESLNYYVTKKEITYFALKAQKDTDLEKVTEEIQKFRLASPLEQESMKAEIAQIFDHRERSDKGARAFESAHSDVAHTFMLICNYTGLVEYIRGDALRIDPEKSQEIQEAVEFHDERYPFNTRYMISLERMAESNGLDVERYKASKMGSIKQATNRSKMQRKIDRMLEGIPNPSVLSVNDLKQILESELPSREAEVAAEMIASQELASISSEFVRSYLAETNDRIFEDKTAEIFKALGFEVVMRPKSVNLVRTEVEILLKYGLNSCAIIDAKMYRPKFALPAHLISHMASEYIPNYDKFEGRDVKFFGYVTVADFGGEKGLEKITRTVYEKTLPGRNIQGIMITASALLAFLDYCMEENLNNDERVELFLRSIKNKGYKSFGQLLNNITSLV